MAVIGNSNHGTTFWTQGANRPYLYPFAATADGTLTNVHSWTKQQNSPAKYTWIMYSTGGSRIDYSAEFTSTGSGTPSDLTSAAQVGASISNGTTYEIGYFTDNGTVDDQAYDTDAANNNVEQTGVTYVFPPPATLTLGDAGTQRKNSIWFDYTPSGGDTLLGQGVM